MNDQATIEAWAKENGIAGIRFYPSNPSASTPGDILTGAMEVIKSIESGRVAPFEDVVTEA